ncbi:MAG: hypothetical protein GF384_00825 [Elusimicrobia bacterium]|nr:hypothetical protein [Elusimicrobiota bacterium]
MVLGDINMYRTIMVWMTVMLWSVSALCKENERSNTEIDKINRRIDQIERNISDSNKNSQEPLICETSLREGMEGIAVSGGMTLIIQGTHNANGDDVLQGSEDTTDATYSVDLGFEKKFNDSASGFIHCETGDGQGVENELTVFSNVNRDADDSDNGLSVTEAWIDYAFGDSGFSTTVGKLDPTVFIDTNEYANDETTQFMGHVFRNSAVIPFPDNALGMCVSYAIYDIVGVDILTLDGKDDADDIGHDFFSGLQVNVMHEIFEKSGNYRFIAWLDKRRYVRWDNPAEEKDTGSGFGISMDQTLTPWMGVFARYHWTDEDIYRDGEEFSLKQDISFGFSIAGKTWGRRNDVLSIAYGVIDPSDAYKEATNRIAYDEKHAECFYNLSITDQIALTPHVHVIWDPYGGDAVNGDNTLTVGGLRIQVNF